MVIDLCIVSYNNQPDLSRLLKSISPSGPGFTVNVVDNDSTDGSSELLDHFEPNLDLLMHSPNVGYAAACNKLASKTEGDIIGLLNCDVMLHTKHLHMVAEAFKEDPHLAILGPKQRDSRGFITHAGIGGTNTQPKHRAWHVHDPDDSLFRTKDEMVTVSGAAYFIRRGVWDALTNDPEYQAVFEAAALDTASILGHDPSYWLNYPGAFLPTPFYYEETFCSYFARHRGYKLCYDGRISITHEWHGSHEKGSPMDHMFRPSQALFRSACSKLGIECD